MKPVILDLCGGTGSWSRPYEEAGYEVVTVTLPSSDVRLFTFSKPVHGILAGPPCTHFSGAGARWWKKKGLGPLLDGLSVVDACLRAVFVHKPKWWVLENPAGRLTQYLGKPTCSFQPHEFGDPWQKRTLLWGQFVAPKKTPIPWPPADNAGERWKRSVCNCLSPKPSRKQIESLVKWGLVPADWETRFGSNPPRELLRSITPPGFARAFFEANP